MLLGVEVDARDRVGRTVLHGSSSDGLLETIDALVVAGANVQARDY